MARANTKAKDTTWQLQEAKSRLSQVVDHALREGPQTITLRGKPAVVVFSFEEFQNPTRPCTSVREFLRQSSLFFITRISTLREAKTRPERFRYEIPSGYLRDLGTGEEGATPGRR